MSHIVFFRQHTKALIIEIKKTVSGLGIREYMNCHLLKSGNALMRKGIGDRLIPGERHGSIAVVLLGFLSVMILFAFFLSFRMSHQSRMILLLDQSLTSRYFLESNVGDICFFLRERMNAFTDKAIL